MRIKSARDLYDVIVPLFFVSRILGVATFRLKHKHFIPSYYNWLILTRLVFVVGLMSYMGFLIEDLDTSQTITSIALHCELYLGITMTWVVLILSIVNQKSIIKLIMDIIKIDNELKSIGANVSYANAQKFVYIQTISITCVFLSKVIIQSFVGSQLKLFIYTVFNFVDYINTIMLFQYLDFLLLIRQRFIWLNRVIRLLPTTNFCYYQFERNKLISFVSLKDIARIHNKLFELCKLLNRTYGVQLLVTISARFIMTTTQLLNIYNIFQNTNSGSAISFGIVGIYIFLHVSKIFAILSLSENTAAKGRDSGLYLHKISSYKNEFKDDVSIGKFVKSLQEITKALLFSLQIIHQDLRFSACGFFPLDYTVMHSIVGAVTTYLVIIIQFDLNKDKKVLIDYVDHNTEDFFVSLI